MFNMYVKMESFYKKQQENMARAFISLRARTHEYSESVGSVQNSRFKTFSTCSRSDKCHPARREKN